MGPCLDEEAVIAFSQGLASRDTQLAVERHLDECPHCFAWVANMVHVSSRENRSAIDTTAPMAEGFAATEATARYSLTPGQRLSRYEIVEQLGAGSMGVVYRAYDPALRRHVALKVIRSGGRVAPGGASALRVRLLAEAHALAQVTHPNVVTIYDLGFIDEQIFIAMELIEGSTLRGWLQETRRGWREILARYLDAAVGLAAAHASGLVHRDFKPDNVLVSGARVVVTDFGLVCSLSAEKASGEAEQVGTPAYMAPEQFRGESADPRTDIFNFCAAMYESLYGQPAFAGDSAEERRVAVLAGRLRPPRPDARVPRWLRVLLLRGLALDRAHRPGSMTELIEALQHDARARRRWLMIAAAVGLVAVGASSAGVTAYHSPLSACERRGEVLGESWSVEAKQHIGAAFARSGLGFQAQTWQTVENILDRYVRAWSDAHAQACRATHRDGVQSARTLDLRLACLEERQVAFSKLTQVLATGEAGVVTQAVSAAAQLETVESCADLAGLSAPLPPPRDEHTRAAIPEVRRRLAEARGLQLAGKYGDAARVAAAALERAQAIGYGPLRAEARVRVASIEKDQGRWFDAAQEYSAAIDDAERGRADFVRAQGAIEMVEVVGHRETKLADGNWWAHQAEVIVERIGNPVRDRAALLANRGLLRLSEGKLDEAEADLRQALDLRKQALPPDDPLLGRTMANIAAVLQTKGRYADAEALYANARAQLTASLGAEHPRVAFIEVNLATISFSRGRFREAQARYMRALAVETHALGERHPHVISTLANVANVANVLGDYARAADYGERALASARASNPDSVEATQMEANLALYLANLGRFERARELADDALARRSKQLGKNQPPVGETEYYVSLVYLAERSLDDAMQHGQAALTLLEGGYGEHHPLVAKALNVVGNVERERGRPLDAISAHQRALDIAKESASDREVALTLTQLGTAELAAGLQRDARDHLERSLALQKRDDGDPYSWAEAAFALARALGREPADATRANHLAHAALEVFERGGPRWVPEITDIRRWFRHRANKPLQGGQDHAE